MGGGGEKEGGDEIHMRKELILGGKSCIFQRGEGGSEGNLTESDVRNPI